MATDRNLLCGILALQLNFVSREQLIAAMNAWILEKQTSLDEMFVRRGVVDSDTRDLLVALVERHLEFHEGDAEKSLASLSSIGSAKDALLSLRDLEVNATLHWVAQSRNRPGATTIPNRSTGEVDPGSANREGVRFHVVRPHAKGGLGEVFVARDEELNREVALKEIQPAFADSEESRARFRQEAEITGNLEHPGIVPVYGLGKYGNGRPFYAMRFIRGDSLKDATLKFHTNWPAAADQSMNTGEANLELRQLLGRLIDVCNAIEFAHSRGVLHRDLKPGNIVLGKYGETLVVDWGLAKAMGQDSEITMSVESLRLSSGSGSTPTMEGTVIGTPAYMSPEQAKGQLDELGPATDVYSLGATLYHVLTGQAPFSHESLNETIRHVRAGEFPPPRAIRGDVPPPLEAICLRAMALNGRDRYASPIQLAADIERWLGDEPVRAFTYPLTASAARWVRKHQTLTTTAISAVVLCAVGLGITTTLISGKNSQLQQLVAELDDKNRELVASNERERAAKQMAELNRQTADENAGEAREQSALALESLSSVITDIQEDLRFMPGASQLRRELLRNALTQLEGVSARFASQESIDRSTMVGLHDLGKIYLRIGPGVSEEASSPLDSAAAAYRQAFSIAEQLQKRQPSSVEANIDLAKSWQLLGDVEFQYGNYPASLDAYQQQLTLCRRLTGDEPSEIEFPSDDDYPVESQHNLAVALYNVASMQLSAAQTESARDLFQSVLDIRLKLAAAMPEDKATQQRLAEAYSYLSRVATQEGKHAESLEQVEKAIEICERMVEVDRDDVRNQQSLALMNSHLGRTLTNLNRYEAARAPCAIARDIRKRIADQNPGDLVAQQILATTYRALGDIELKAGTPDRAEEPYRAAAEIDRRLAEADPSDAQAQFDLYISYHKAAATQHIQEKFQEAIETYQLGLDVLNGLREDGRLSNDNEQWIGVVENAIRQCNLSPIAFGDWDVLMGQPTEVLADLLELRAQHLATKDRAEDAEQAVNALRGLGSATAGQLFNAAGVLNNCLKRTELLDDTPESKVENLGKDGIATLREAIEAGFDDVLRLKNDPYIDRLRDRPEFQSLVDLLGQR